MLLFIRDSDCRWFRPNWTIKVAIWLLEIRRVLLFVQDLSWNDFFWPVLALRIICQVVSQAVWDDRHPGNWVVDRLKCLHGSHRSFTEWNCGRAEHEFFLCQNRCVCGRFPPELVALVSLSRCALIRLWQLRVAASLRHSLVNVARVASLCICCGRALGRESCAGFGRRALSSVQSRKNWHNLLFSLCLAEARFCTVSHRFFWLPILIVLLLLVCNFRNLMNHLGLLLLFCHELNALCCCNFFCAG